MAAKSLFNAGHDRACRSDRQLLTDDLENECPERIERRELVHPRPRTKSWMRVDDARENRIRFAKELASLAVSKRSGLSRTSTDAHAEPGPGKLAIRGAPMSSLTRTAPTPIPAYIAMSPGSRSMPRYGGTVALHPVF
jgi:hypothetical protein